jgi:hypothetical protein
MWKDKIKKEREVVRGASEEVRCAAKAAFQVTCNFIAEKENHKQS